MEHLLIYVNLEVEELQKPFLKLVIDVYILLLWLPTAHTDCDKNSDLFLQNENT